jgi:hypothetical protein
MVMATTFCDVGRPYTSFDGSPLGRVVGGGVVGGRVVGGGVVGGGVVGGRVVGGGVVGGGVVGGRVVGGGVVAGGVVAGRVVGAIVVSTVVAVVGDTVVGATVVVTVDVVDVPVEGDVEPVSLLGVASPQASSTNAIPPKSCHALDMTITFFGGFSHFHRTPIGVGAQEAKDRQPADRSSRKRVSTAVLKRRCCPCAFDCMNRANILRRGTPSGPDECNSIAHVYTHESPSGSKEWVAIARTGRAGLTFSITILRPGSHSRTTDTAFTGTPHIRNRITLWVPTRIGSWSGVYSRTAGSMTGAVEGSARKSKA